MRLRRDPAPKGWHPNVTRREMQEAHTALLAMYLDGLELALRLENWELVEHLRQNISDDLQTSGMTYAQALAEIRAS